LRDARLSFCEEAGLADRCDLRRGLYRRPVSGRKGAGAKIRTVLEATCQRWRSSELKSFRPERQSNV
jgi:hypothetical protein